MRLPIRHLAWALSAASLALHAQQRQPQTRRLNAKQQPKVIARAEAAYSKEGLITEAEGNVTLSMLISPEGVPQNVKVSKSLGFGLDEAAVKAASNFRFLPGRVNGKPAAMETKIQVAFRSKSDERAWHLVHGSFSGNAATRPVVLEAVYPDSGPDEDAYFTVAFKIDQQGTPSEITVQASSDPQFNTALTDFMKTWKFRPAAKDGAPAAIGCKFDVVWSAGTGAPMPQSLKEAALRGDLAAAIDLLSSGANPNLADSQGITPLHEAALKGRTAMTLYLLSHGSKLNVRTGNGTLPLHEAVLGGNAATVRALLNAGADVSARITGTMQTPLHLAAAWGRTAVIEELLSRGADKKAKDARHRTPQDVAIENTQNEAAQILTASPAPQERP